MSSKEANAARKPAQTGTPSQGLHVAMVVRLFSAHGGLELYTFELVRGLLDRGVRVTVICAEDHSSIEHPLLTVQKFAEAPAGLSKWQRIEHYFKAASEAVKENGPFDLVHSQHLPFEGADVVTFHNHTAARLSDVGQAWEQSLNQAKISFIKAYKLRDQYDRYLCKTASTLIFPSEACRDDFAERYKLSTLNPAASLVVAHPGATLADDPADILNKPLNIIKVDPFTFLFVGKGFRKKGLDILLKACSLLHRRGRIFKLLIAGLKAKPLDRGRLALMRLSDRVHYLGFQKDMDKVYNRASVIILPSRIEPFGMAPLQAMLRGIVPLVSRVSGVAEVLTNEKDALILENHLSADELADHMERLMSDLQFTKELSKNAAVTARNCSWQKTVDSTLAGYENVLARRRT